MTSSASLHLKTFFLISLMIMFGPLGNVSLSKGMKTIGAISLHSPADLSARRPANFCSLHSSGSASCSC